MSGNTGGMHRAIYGRWVVPIEPKDTFYENHAVIFQDKKIVEVLPIEKAKEKYPHAAVTDLSKEHVILPGRTCCFV